MEKLFSYAGVSRKCSKLKVRWANTANRSRMLEADGQTDINLVELPHAMTKLAAAEWLLESAFSQDTETLDLLRAYTGKTAPAKQAEPVPAAPPELKLITCDPAPLLLTYQPAKAKRGAGGRFLKKAA